MSKEPTIKLVTQADMGKALHVAVHINSEKDVGMLYLTEDEYNILVKVLEAGIGAVDGVSITNDNSAVDPVYDEYEYNY